MITVCDRSGLCIGEPSTFSSLRGCSPGPAKRAGPIEYDGTGQPALRCGDRVSDHRRKCSSVTLS
jgi:hypothetical protein